MTRTQINTDSETYAALAALALDLGYVQTNGPRVGSGSPVKMLAALAVALRESHPKDTEIFRRIFGAYLLGVDTKPEG